jgi:hypothetical protein
VKCEKIVTSNRGNVSNHENENISEVIEAISIANERKQEEENT